ncbi:MAG: PEP-CTERM sorting domain-containing protein [Cellvibrio sp.]|uniref:PEP-CTERM sorting domain-containing protein n=1 Tax=Cellvibrio sp. TaxID=1965322 RepID=UPI0031B51A3B
MRQSLFKKISLLCTLLFCMINPAKAALITTEFSNLVGNEGTVDINLSLSNGETFNGFSLYFSENLFSNLTIISAPTEWDSVVFQPDSLLGAGLFDSYNAAGLSTGFARISFTYLSNLPFQSLAYYFYDVDFNVVESGTSTNVPASVPESSSLILLMLGLIAVALRAHSSNKKLIAHPINTQQVAA